MRQPVSIKVRSWRLHVLAFVMAAFAIALNEAALAPFAGIVLVESFGPPWSVTIRRGKLGSHGTVDTPSLRIAIVTTAKVWRRLREPRFALWGSDHPATYQLATKAHRDSVVPAYARRVGMTFRANVGPAIAALGRSAAEADAAMKHMAQAHAGASITVNEANEALSSAKAPKPQKGQRDR